MAQKAPTEMSNLSTVREWLTLAAAGASATFAGMIWWMARKRLATRYEIWTVGRGQKGTLGVGIRITNRGDDDIRVENVTVDPPLKILVHGNGGSYGVNANQEMVASATRATSCPREVRVAPDKSEEFQLLLERGGGFNSVSSVSIALHILSIFPTTRQRKKVLTLTLPASIRSAQT